MTATQPSVTPDARLSHSDEVLYQEVGGEAVLLDLASEQYFGLDPVGTRIWELMDGHRLLSDIHDVLCGEFDADRDRIGSDLLALVQSLMDAGLVKAQ